MEMSTGTGYHQFQPLLYQAIAELTGRDITFEPDRVFGRHANIDARAAEVISVDPRAATVTPAGGAISGDVLVPAAGSQPIFFHTPGAAEHACPLCSVDDARRIGPWRIMQPLLDAPPPVRPYPPGSWGPAGAAASPAGHGGWHGPWIAS
jgi:NADH dehydrogenase FAD-containing subunit